MRLILNNMEYSQDKAFKNKEQPLENTLKPQAFSNKAISLQDNRPVSMIQRKANNTGLPNNLKSGIENLSGHSMDDVKVHYNSDKPAQLNAHAYAQGSDIHIASGQEKHLPHEAWHVVQQKQGRVKPTLQMKGKVNINDDAGLEKEADVMGAKAMQLKDNHSSMLLQKKVKQGVLQRVETISVDKAMSQSLIDPGKAAAKEYVWQSSFTIYLYNKADEVPRVQVVIYISTPASADVFAAWNQSITQAWNNKFAIKSGVKSYPITVEIIKVKGPEFKNYEVENVKQDVAHGVRGLFGTESMTKWGEGDPQDIPHEVGHMIGNKDEYGTVDGKNWSAEHNPQDPDTHSIMYKGGEPPRLRHFNLILEEIQKKDILEAPTLVKNVGLGQKHAMIPVAKKALTHEERITKISDYLMNNIDKINEEQEAYLKSLNWSQSEEGSKTAAKWLSLI
jgi:Domain of unknown function (DUF4157)